MDNKHRKENFEGDKGRAKSETLLDNGMTYRLASSPLYVMSSNGALDSVVPTRKSTRPVRASMMI